MNVTPEPRRERNPLMTSTIDCIDSELLGLTVNTVEPTQESSQSQPPELEEETSSLTELTNVPHSPLFPNTNVVISPRLEARRGFSKTQPHRLSTANVDRDLEKLGANFKVFQVKPGNQSRPTIKVANALSQLQNISAAAPQNQSPQPIAKFSTVTIGHSQSSGPGYVQKVVVSPGKTPATDSSLRQFKATSSAAGFIQTPSSTMQQPIGKFSTVTIGQRQITVPGNVQKALVVPSTSSAQPRFQISQIMKALSDKVAGNALRSRAIQNPIQNQVMHNPIRISIPRPMAPSVPFTYVNSDGKVFMPPSASMGKRLLPRLGQGSPQRQFRPPDPRLVIPTVPGTVTIQRPTYSFTAPVPTLIPAEQVINKRPATPPNSIGKIARKSYAEAIRILKSATKEDAANMQIQAERKEKEKPLVRNIVPGTQEKYRTPRANCINRNGQVKRPMNAFMVWARHERLALSKEFPHITNSEVSVKLGDRWQTMTEMDKKPFYDESMKIKMLHNEQFPGWTYRPKGVAAKIKETLASSSTSSLWNRYRKEGKITPSDSDPTIAEGDPLHVHEPNKTKQDTKPVSTDSTSAKPDQTQPEPLQMQYDPATGRYRLYSMSLTQLDNQSSPTAEADAPSSTSTTQTITTRSASVNLTTESSDQTIEKTTNLSAYSKVPSVPGTVQGMVTPAFPQKPIQLLAGGMKMNGNGITNTNRFSLPNTSVSRSAQVNVHLSQPTTVQQSRGEMVNSQTNKAAAPTRPLAEASRLVQGMYSVSSTQRKQPPVGGKIIKRREKTRTQYQQHIAPKPINRTANPPDTISPLTISRTVNMLNEPVRTAEVQLVTNLDGNGSVVNLPIFVNPPCQPVPLSNVASQLIQVSGIASTQNRPIRPAPQAQGIVLSVTPAANAELEPTVTISSLDESAPMPQNNQLQVLQARPKSTKALDLSVTGCQRKPIDLTVRGSKSKTTNAAGSHSSIRSNTFQGSLLAHITPGSTVANPAGKCTSTKMLVDLPLAKNGPVPLVVNMASQNHGTRNPVVEVYRPKSASPEERNHAEGTTRGNATSSVGKKRKAEQDGQTNKRRPPGSWPFPFDPYGDLSDDEKGTDDHSQSPLSLPEFPDRFYFNLGRAVAQCCINVPQPNREKWDKYLNSVTPSCSHDSACDCALTPLQVPSNEDCPKKKNTGKRTKKNSKKDASKPALTKVSTLDLQTCTPFEINALYPCPILRDIDADTSEFDALQFHIHQEEPEKVEKLQKRKKRGVNSKEHDENTKKGRQKSPKCVEVAGLRNISMNDVMNDSRQLVVDLDLDPYAAQEEIMTLTIPSRNNSNASLQLSASEERHVNASKIRL